MAELNLLQNKCRKFVCICVEIKNERENNRAVNANTIDSFDKAPRAIRRIRRQHTEIMRERC